MLSLPQESGTDPVKVCSNRDRILISILTQDSILIWYAKPCVPIISHRRSPQSVSELGTNRLVCWRPDSSMIAVATTGGHIIFYNLVVLTDLKSLYEQEDPDNQALKRESAELFFKENVPPLVFSQAFEVPIPGGITDLACIRDELMVATNDGHILRYLWDGQANRDYCLDLRRIPFCVDQQVLRAVPLVEETHVINLAYSPLLGGFAIVLDDGRAAFLVANTLKFDPNGVQGIWAGGVEDATCTALNHKYRLIAFGRSNSHGIVYSIDESTGGLEVSHHLQLPTKDYPGCPGPVTALKWTPDSTSLALVWAAGGFSIWSTFGSMIMCSLGWDHGQEIMDVMKKSPYNIQDLDWSAEGYQLWVVNKTTRQFTGKKDADFCPYPTQHQENDDKNDCTSHLGDSVLVIPFVKSPLTVNPAMSANDQLYLQGEDRIYMNTGDAGISQRKEALDKIGSIINSQSDGGNLPDLQPNASIMQSSHTKQWTIVSIPHAYISSSWPIRYTACDPTGHWLAVAGRTGLAYYCDTNKKWKLFGNETQEKDFIVTGGILWWKDFLVIGCFNISANRDEVRLYPRDARLENAYCTTEEVDAQVLLLNRLGDRLVVYCANSHISLYQLTVDASNSLLACLTKVQDVDASALSIHPACVVSITLTHLRTEARQRSGDGRESTDRSTCPGDDSASLIMNVSGRLVLIQRERGTGDEMLYSPPTVLAGSCEQVWLPPTANRAKPHLTLALWLYCGAAGMRVWLPLFPREGESSHAFMARRIMLHFPLKNIYPLAILFEDALMLGVENDVQVFPETSKSSPSSLPFCVLGRVSEVYLQQLLRQLIRRNLGQHAWEIAHSCSSLPYFQHSLELLLHSVLEEEATSKDPIPDALLPSIVDFIRSFPVYRETVVRCTRKTEVALWPYLFAAVGSPKDLFSECLEKGELSTAASYLIVLQSLEPASVARQHATQLLDAALDGGNWKLAKELIRFLRAIDPDECDELASPRISQIMPPFSSPISPPHAEVEDLSLVLGTLVGPRTRSISVNQPVKGGSPPEPQTQNHQSLSRSASEKGAKLKRLSNSSSQNTSRDAGTAEEFFIDVILARHARKLLTAGKLADLGTFQANLDYPVVSWLRREKHRAGQVNDFVWAVKKVHQDFDWPWPGENGVRSRHDNPSLMSNEIPTLVEDNLRQLHIDTGGNVSSRNQMDSGYMSQGASRPTRQSDLSLLSEQTVDAMLRMRERHDDQRSIRSDDLGSVCGIQSPTLTTSPSFPATPKEADPPPKAKAKLNYMLNLLLEAECLEWASCFAFILMDVMAIIRIVNAARSATDSNAVVERLHKGFLQLESFSSSNSPGYWRFLIGIQPQVGSLANYISSTKTDDNSDEPGEAVSHPSSTPRSLSRSVSDPGEKMHLEKTSQIRARTPSPTQTQEASESEQDSGCLIM